jgi:hypothetical protein
MIPRVFGFFRFFPEFSGIIYEGTNKTPYIEVTIVHNTRKNTKKNDYIYYCVQTKMKIRQFITYIFIFLLLNLYNKVCILIWMLLLVKFLEEIGGRGSVMVVIIW